MGQTIGWVSVGTGAGRTVGRGGGEGRRGLSVERREKDGLMSKGEIGNKCSHQLFPNPFVYKQAQTGN